VIRAFLDTNVLASGLRGFQIPTSAPGEVMRRWRDGAFILLVSEHVLAELERTLANPYFMSRISRNQVDQALATLRRYGQVVDSADTVTGVASHPEDDRVLAAVRSASADVLVTGDKQLLAIGHFGRTEILTPSSFVEVLDRTVH
jgi:putative PIN family toxin of toxin-antitoxin system